MEKGVQAVKDKVPSVNNVLENASSVVKTGTQFAQDLGKGLGILNDDDEKDNESNLKNMGYQIGKQISDLSTFGKKKLESMNDSPQKIQERKFAQERDEKFFKIILKDNNKSSTEKDSTHFTYTIDHT